MDDILDTKARNKLIKNSASDRNRLLIRQSIGYYVLCKVVKDNQYVPGTMLRAGQRADNVHRDLLKWCLSVNRSEGPTVARVSCMSIACWTVLAPVLNVFDDFQPVETLLYFFDCLRSDHVLNSVNELEDLLLHGARDDCAKRSFGSFADWNAQAKNAVFDCTLVTTRPVIPQVLRLSLELFLSKALCLLAP